MSNIYPHLYQISPDDRSVQKGHKPTLIWFTGLSASGKSTIADRLAHKLHQLNFHTYNLDGDTLRFGLNKDLGFSDEARSENLRRAAEVSKIMMDAGLIVLSAFITPFAKDREMIRNIVGEKYYIEIYVSTPLEECERRDVKGLYARARRGEIKQFTGIDSAYEIPEKSDLVIDTVKLSPDEAADLICQNLLPRIKL